MGVCCGILRPSLLVRSDCASARPWLPASDGVASSHLPSNHHRLSASLPQACQMSLSVHPDVLLCAADHHALPCPPSCGPYCPSRARLPLQTMLLTPDGVAKAALIVFVAHLILPILSFMFSSYICLCGTYRSLFEHRQDMEIPQALFVRCFYVFRHHLYSMSGSFPSFS